MIPAPNQYRCETCKHNKTVPNTILYRCELRDIRISLSESVFINHFGCASHSSEVSEQVSVIQDEEGYIEKRQMQSERDKLKELEEYINDNSPWLPGTDDRVIDARRLVAHIRELRSTGSREL